MAQDTIPTGEYYFSSIIDSSDEIIPSRDSSTALTLNSYVDTPSTYESPDSSSEGIQIHTLSPADRRLLTLEHILRRLSMLEID